LIKAGHTARRAPAITELVREELYLRDPDQNGVGCIGIGRRSNGRNNEDGSLAMLRVGSISNISCPPTSG